MKKRIFVYILIVVLFSSFSFILGNMIGEKGVSISDSEIFLETEKYSFRDSEGHRVDILENEVECLQKDRQTTDVYQPDENTNWSLSRIGYLERIVTPPSQRQNG